MKERYMRFGEFIKSKRLADPRELTLKDVAEKLGVSPDECIVIEDSPAGIMAGYNAGMTSFHVEDLKKADEEIIKYSDKQFKNLIEVREYLNL